MGRPRFKVSSQQDVKKKNDKQRDAAWKAVQNFSRMTPMLTAFARSLTGNPKLMVKAGKVTATDGKNVFIRPPLSLAETVQHDRTLCDTRDGNMQLMCPSCQLSEEVWRGLHHEVSHILGDSMALPDNDVISEMLKLIEEWHPADACKHGTDLRTKVQSAREYLTFFNSFSSWTWMVSQALEDARIDSMMLGIKPGLRQQFYASTYKLFTVGVEGSDGTVAFWHDAPINSQIVIGLMLKGSGYEIQEGWLRPEVLDILDDEQLTDITDGVRGWSSVHETSAATIRAFRRLNELGFCREEKCQAMPSLGKPGDSPSEGENDSDESDGDATGETGDAGEDSSGSDSGDADASPDGGDGSGDDSSDVQEDATGDGTAGGTASSGAFGDDFENDARSSGSDHEGGTSDDQLKEESLPDGDGHDEPESGESQSGDQDANDPDGDGSVDAGSEDQVESERSASGDDETEADEDDTEEDSEGHLQSSAEDFTPDADVTDPAQRGTGDIGGPPAEDGNDDLQDGQDDQSDGGEVAESESIGTDSESEDFADGSSNLEEDEERESELLGENVWDTPNASSFDPSELGTAEDALQVFQNHSPHDDTEAQANAAREARGEEIESNEDDDRVDYNDERVVISENRALDDAIGQSMYFDKSSVGLGGVKEYTFPEQLFRWEESYRYGTADFMPSEAVIGKALMVGRNVFAANRRATHVTNLTSGRINTRVLGRRAATGDARLFKSKITPNKRDYIVAITVDCSGSTGRNNRMERMKRAVFAKAELLSRLGVPFYITGHTGGMDAYWNSRVDEQLEDLMILWIKKIDEPWNDDTRKRLAALKPLANNFDGHTLEFHRKILERRRETDRILIYYTDGEMPAANHDEELEVLQRELARMDQLGIKRLAVGINTNSPEEYGFDTVEVEGDDDLVKVVEQLKVYLTR